MTATLAAPAFAAPSITDAHFHAWHWDPATDPWGTTTCATCGAKETWKTPWPFPAISPAATAAAAA